MPDLAMQDCVPCKGGTPPLKGAALDALLKQTPGWKAVNEHHLEKNFDFPDFAKALAYVNKVGAMAEQQGHHPDLLLRWGKVVVTTWTHSIDGLSESDFVLAAKCDRLYS